jgi:hypothetical protein
MRLVGVGKGSDDERAARLVAFVLVVVAFALVAATLLYALAV